MTDVIVVDIQVLRYISNKPGWFTVTVMDIITAKVYNRQYRLYPPSHVSVKFPELVTEEFHKALTMYNNNIGKVIEVEIFEDRYKTVNGFKYVEHCPYVELSWDNPCDYSTIPKGTKSLVEEHY